MKYTYTPEKLTLECSPEEQAELREISAAYTEEGRKHWTDQDECEFLERLICNSELDWTDSRVTGDLTDAPLLCIWGDENTPVAMRWGYPHYQLRSFLTDLMETGRAVFRSSW